MNNIYLSFLFILGFSTQLNAECPAPVAAAVKSSQQLVVVTSTNWNGPEAKLQVFNRTTTGSWKAATTAVDAVTGIKGVAWGHNLRGLSSAQSPAKNEGDQKAPIGAFPIGKRFGFGGTASGDYLPLEKNTYCVDDVGSKHYNQVIDAGVEVQDWRKGTGEYMAQQKLYRNGYLIDYPSNAHAHAGSCIFLHVWPGSPNKGTVGCIAASEDSLKQLNPTMVVVPSTEREKWTCLPQGQTSQAGDGAPGSA